MHKIHYGVLKIHIRFFVFGNTNDLENVPVNWLLLVSNLRMGSVRILAGLPCPIWGRLCNGWPLTHDHGEVYGIG